GFKPRAMVDVSKAFEEARLLKDDEEVQSIRKAISITKLAIMQAQKYLREGITELTFAAQIEYIMKSLGATGLAFDTIVAFGKNAALPHHMPDETKLKSGDFVLIDTGAKYKNYCADISRTIIFDEKKARNAKRMEEMLKVVKDAQLMAIKAIKPGISGAKVSKMVTSYINSYANGRYKGKFIHALGHSVGIEVHDATIFSKKPSVKIKDRMVLAIEPGIYINGFGGVRIEDDILVTKDGAVVL
ncbi:MAG: M24 family metallopeptidase, partial [Candidatus Micrarchaeia archaeon]